MSRNRKQNKERSKPGEFWAAKIGISAGLRVHSSNYSQSYRFNLQLHSHPPTGDAHSFPMKPLPHEYYMSIALKEAIRALDEEEVPIGCIIVAQNQIVGKGYNQVERLRDVTAHAEILAITAASTHFQSKYLKGCTLYVTVEPCMMCATAIGWAQISQLVYGADDPKKGYTLFDPSPLHPKTRVERGIMDEACRELMKEFFRRKR